MLTTWSTEHAVDFIKRHKDGPFLLYVPHSMPHVPLFASNEFAGKSLRGTYGDVIEEIDSSVGKILSALKQEGLDEKTLVVFTSDNGPWISFKEIGGSAGLLRMGKGSTWEGGVREPAIVRWPSKIKPGTVNPQMASTLDLFPTMVSLAGGNLPDRRLDGFDLKETLLHNEPSPRDTMFFYRTDKLWAVRKGKYKAHFMTQSGYGGDKRVDHDPPLLFDLEVDPSEKYNVANQYPEKIEEIRTLVDDHQSKLNPMPSQLTQKLKK